MGKINEVLVIWSASMAASAILLDKHPFGYNDLAWKHIANINRQNQKRSCLKTGAGKHFVFPAQNMMKCKQILSRWFWHKQVTKHAHQIASSLYLLPSRELTCPTWGKREIIDSKVPAIVGDILCYSSTCRPAAPSYQNIHPLIGS